MHIHEVIIDGFKSYAKRTVISGFDPQFNAITGLNGTGKSNVLDAICFVLGISNLSQVRAGSLQELVYKQGQAGVIKASVTIVFNNPDSNNSPITYESKKQITVTRQIVIGGKNKYMIDGKQVQQSEINNFFHSVQLNVNNPHFLIMQGRITKVLNMKPVEILSMIEEAAGTRMFQTKKEAAMKTIEKKQLRVNELSKCMDDEISPQLEGLREQKQHYTVYQSNSTELGRLQRFCIASDYQQLENTVNENQNGKASIIAERVATEASKQENKEKSEECDAKIEDINSRLKDEMKGEFTALKQSEEDLSKSLVLTKTSHKNHAETVKTEKEIAVTLEKQVESAKESLVAKQIELQNAEKAVTAKEEESDAADKEALSMRDRHQNALAGVADESSADTLSVPEQVAILEKRAREALSQLQQGFQRAEYAKTKLKELTASAKNQTSSHSKSVEESDSLRAAITAAEGKLKGISFSEKEEEALRLKSSNLHTSTSALKDDVDRITTQLGARLNFEFKDPEKGFDRSKVKGLVARLVKVTNSLNATALEVAAGGKLYQVVVDTEQTGKLLLQKGGLKSRVTILPLTGMNNKCTDTAKVTLAKELAISKNTKAMLALELVEFDEEVRKAMEYTFGNCIICDNSEVAKEIAFDKKIRNRTVTLEGDSFDPTGTMTGGARNSIGSLLSRITDLASATSALELQLKELRGLDAQLKGMEDQGIAARGLERELDLKRHALKMCEDKLAGSSYTQIANDVIALEASLITLEEESVTLKATNMKANDDLKKLKETEKNVKKAREGAMMDLETQMKKAQKSAAGVKDELSKLRNKRDGLIAEYEGLQRDLVSQREQLIICTAGVGRYEKEVEVYRKQLVDLLEKYETAKAVRSAKEKEMSACSAEIKSYVTMKNKADKAYENAGLELRKIEVKLTNWEKDAKDSKKKLEELTKNNLWIQAEKSFFGRKDSDFDFEARNVDESKKRIKELTVAQDQLKLKVNEKVMGLLETAENDYSELYKKKNIIINDKQKIEAVIGELDVKKAQALQTTWIKVNRDFGSIFTMLLPGTMAKLEPPEGGTVMDGLEVKVAFNGVWKDSLTELSGGQRSLLALSLILSLLLFKPAPMYILDEVDAALDLSHTQNIGMMLRTHFSTSQFIVVSLKEGMFNNANVIFRTRFVDGSSAVTRTVVGGKNRPTQAVIEDEEEAAPQKKKGKTGAKIVKASGSENVY